MGEFLAKILMETNQEVPDFLHHFKPEDGVLNFDEEEEEDDLDLVATNDGSGGAAWGSGGDVASAPAGDATAATAGDSWGSGVDNGAAAKFDAW